MATASADVSIPERPHHRRNKSSRSGILKNLVSPKARPVSPELSPDTSQRSKGNHRTQTVPLLPPDHPHGANPRVLGERQSNVQSPPASPSKQKGRPASFGRKDRVGLLSPNKGDSSKPKKSKSSTSLAAMFGKMNRSSKDLSVNTGVPGTSNKENDAPPSSTSGTQETPIWAQFSSTNGKSASRPGSRDSKSSIHVQEEIARYTPQDYSPSKQRNFNGAPNQPSLRPAIRHRPHSEFIPPTDGLGDISGRRMNGARISIEARRSEDSPRNMSSDYSQRVSMERNGLRKSTSADRKTSGSSGEQTASRSRLDIMKRGGRVMAAVAALQGKTKEVLVKEEAQLDPQAVDEAFESVLDSRNVPEPMRQKMRSLTLRVKADFVKQDQEASKCVENSPVDQKFSVADTHQEQQQQVQQEDNGKSTKRSRPRSRTFTFTKRSGESSPSKKQRGQSKSRPMSIQIPKEQPVKAPSAPTTPTGGSFGRKGHAPALPGEYISYIKKNQDPTAVEVGRLHKLRLLLRNETVAWVDSFVAQGGMAEVVGLLHRIMAIEWREEHEDQLLHETLLCLKGLCTTERALAELEQVADELFPALLGMLFDEEKKGPAEYTTRTIIVNVLFNFLTATLNSSPSDLEQRARRILAYLSEPTKPAADTKPIEFVLGMQVPRPYKLWCREVTNVTKEVFWIFLHHLNVVPLPRRPGSSGSDKPSSVPTFSADLKGYTHRHFPGLRPPVPAAPYIGGVEWDATTYITAHLDLLNGLVASLPSTSARNALREDLQSSGFEKTFGSTLRTCKEKFYAGVHDGLRAWVAAAAEDGWETRFVREGPSQEEQVRTARSVSPKKGGKKEEAPQLDIGVGMPRLDFDVGAGQTKLMGNETDDGWIG